MTAACNLGADAQRVRDALGASATPVWRLVVKVLCYAGAEGLAPKVIREAAEAKGFVAGEMNRDAVSHTLGGGQKHAVHVGDARYALAAFPGVVEVPRKQSAASSSKQQLPTAAAAAGAGAAGPEARHGVSSVQQESRAGSRQVPPPTAAAAAGAAAPGASSGQQGGSAGARQVRPHTAAAPEAGQEVSSGQQQQQGHALPTARLVADVSTLIVCGGVG